MIKSVFEQGFTAIYGFISLHSRKILLGLLSIIVVCLVLPPIGMLIFSSVRSTGSLLPFEATTFTLTNYTQVFSSGLTYRLLLNTAWYALGTIIVSMAIAILFAWFLERTDIPFRRTMFVLILAPMGMPGVIKSMAWILLANPANGMFNVILRSFLGMEGPGPINIYSIGGMIVISALSIVPMIYIMISGVFARVDPSFEEAARTGGAKTWTTFRHISMPLLGPAIIAAVIYFLVRTIETFETPAMLGLPRGIFVFSTAIYYATRGSVGGLPDYGVASTYSMVLMLIAGVLIYFYSRYIRRAERFATVTGKGYRPRLIDLGRFKYLPVVLMSGYFFLAVVMPLFILLWTSLAPPFQPMSFSTLLKFNLDHYRHILVFPYVFTAIKNTLFIATTAAMISMLLVTLISWLSIRGGIRGSWIPDRIAFMIIGVPGIVIGLALIFIYASMPIPIYGTTWIIILALVTMSLPFGTRLMAAAFLQIHSELEEAAGTSGAGLRITFFRIVLPLLWPSFARGFLSMFVHSMRETTVALMLYTIGNQTIAVTLWNLWAEQAEFALASTIAVPMMLVTTGLTYFVAKQTMLTGGSV